jgi:hypothetical protein
MEVSHRAVSRARFRWSGLDPAARMAEVTSGIAVVLTLLAGTSFYADDVADPKRVLVGVAVVAALAAGLAGGVIHVVEDLYEDAEQRRDTLELSEAALDDKRALVRAQLAEDLGVDVPDEVADHVVDAMLSKTPPEVRVEAVNLRDVGASILLNLVALVPVLLAFLLIKDWHVALLAAEILLVVGLFVTGVVYGSRLRISRLVCGVLLTLVGIGLVLISSLSEAI